MGRGRGRGEGEGTLGDTWGHLGHQDFQGDTYSEAHFVTQYTIPYVILRDPNSERGIVGAHACGGGEARATPIVNSTALQTAV